MLLLGAGVALMSLLWFEGVKWGFDRRRKDRSLARGVA